jgi:hypothetical protein
VTLIRWADEDRLHADRDLTQTRLAGNLIDATQGATQPVETFVIPLPPLTTQSNLTRALVRTGANDTLQYLHPFNTAGLAWLPQDDPAQAPQPEVILTGVAPTGVPAPWTFLPSLLTAQPFEDAFTLDPVRYARIAGNTPDSLRFDYDGDGGDTLRFGDGAFGTIPLPQTVFTAIYRVGGGALGNMAADSITQIDPKVTGVTGVTNPLPAWGGADAEPHRTMPTQPKRSHG